MNKEEFTQKILALEKSTYHIAKTILKNDEDCADAMQSAILMAYKNLDSLKQKDFFDTWFTRILINECYQIIRGRKPAISYDSYEDFPESALASAESNIEFEQSDVYEEIMRLDEAYMLPFVLHYIEGYSVKEVAQMLDTTQGAVKLRLFRARGILRERLKE